MARLETIAGYKKECEDAFEMMGIVACYVINFGVVAYEGIRAAINPERKSTYQRAKKFWENG